MLELVSQLRATPLGTIPDIGGCWHLRIRRLRTEVDWGSMQDSAACRADAAISHAERGFTTAAAFVAGEVPCQLSAGAPAAQVMVLEDLSIRYFSANGGETAGTATAADAAAAQAARAGGSAKGQFEGSDKAFVWDPTLLAYECPLFARKFPANTSSRVQEVLSLA